MLNSVAFSQCPAFVGSGTSNCTPQALGVNINPAPNLAPVNFVFDEFREYKGGITFNGSSIVRLNVLAANASCKWKLTMYVLNNGFVRADEWEELATYGSGTSGTRPKLDLLQVKVTNGCSTPKWDGWKSFDFPAVGECAYIDIINNVAVLPVPAGTCGNQEVNGAGSYLTNYNEYSFTVDYRIVPGLTLIPGHYTMSIKFFLREE